MRSRILMVAAGVMALTMVAWGGIAVAGEKDDAGSWAWYYEGAIETGNLTTPPPAGVSLQGARAADREEFPVVTAGGLAYRLGIDTE